MHTVREKVQGFIKRHNTNKGLGMLSLVLLLIAIPFTVYVQQQQQETRQYAAEEKLFLITAATAQPGNVVAVSWGLGEASLAATRSVQLSASPSSVLRGQDYSISWEYKDTKPIVGDMVEILTASGIHVGNMYLNSCTNVVGSAAPPKTGQCVLTTKNYGPGVYTIRSFTQTDSQTPPPSIVVTDGQPPVASPSVIPGAGGNGEVRDVDPRTSDRPQSFFFIQKAFAQSTPSATPAVTATPSAAPSATPTAAFTGGETIQLFTAGTNPQAAGRQIYLNCEEKTPSIPVPPVIAAGSCEYPISPNISPGTYVFRMYAADQKTLLAESNTLVISLNQTPASPTQPLQPSVTPATTQTSCMSDADCTRPDYLGSIVMKCFRHGEYPGTCKPADTVCAQVVTRACRNRGNCPPGGGCPDVAPECVNFPNPCVVPPGWVPDGPLPTVAENR